MHYAERFFETLTAKDLLDALFLASRIFVLCRRFQRHRNRQRVAELSIKHEQAERKEIR